MAPLIRLFVFVATKVAFFHLLYDLWRARRNAISRLAFFRARRPDGKGTPSIPTLDPWADIELPTGVWRVRSARMSFGGQAFEVRRPDDARERMIGVLRASESHGSVEGDGSSESGPPALDLARSIVEGVEERWWVSMDGSHYRLVVKPGGLAVVTLADDDEALPVLVHVRHPEGGSELPWTGLGSVSTEELDAWFHSARPRVPDLCA